MKSRIKFQVEAMLARSADRQREVLSSAREMAVDLHAVGAMDDETLERVMSLGKENS